MEVTPLAGVWVEIFIRYRDYNINIVTPLAGVWVEIGNPLPYPAAPGAVTPLAGVWVEILGLCGV